ncbi:MAG: alpha/beta hydrolase-fold protein [Actinomycetota bacterium]|nr:alpha/beta hydrolase-fold protein [Actinomycetota bacterium]
MRRDRVQLGPASLIAYGHYGRAVLVFPTEQGRAEDFENNGMVDAVADLIEAGRVKLYCVDSADDVTWADRSVPIEERARRHGEYESWVRSQVASWVADDCGGQLEITTLGCSLGAFHAVNLTLRHARVFPMAIGLSGNYDPSTWNAWGEHGEATYFNNPMAYVANLSGGHLDWLRERISLLLVVGQGAFEESPTGALQSTRAFADLLSSKGIRTELDVWGHDVPHDWPSWQAQLRHHLPRLC